MLPQRFAQLRESRNLTQSNLAEMLDMSVRAISAWERGDRKPPIDKLEWLADFYGVTTDYLLGRTDVPNAGIVQDGLYAFFSTGKDLSPKEREQAVRLAVKPGDTSVNAQNTLPLTDEQFSLLVERVTEAVLQKVVQKSQEE